MNATATGERGFSGLRAVHGVRECPECGLVQDMPDGRPGETIRCCRCQAWLRSRKRDPVGAAYALALTSAMLFAIALTMPMMKLDIFGRTNTVGLVTGPGVLWANADWLTLVGAMVALASIVIPMLVIGLDIVLLAASRKPELPAHMPRLIRLRARLRPWAMIEVYMLGIFVAYTKLVSLAHVEVEPAIYALAGIMVLMVATDGAFDADAVWERMTPRAGEADGIVTDAASLADRGHDVLSCEWCGLVMQTDASAHADGATHTHRCLRCDAVVHRRKPDSLRRTMAWLAAALILYVPANVLPILTFNKFGSGGPSTIIEGVEELYSSGELPLALLVFVASITVPCVKVVGLAAMVALTRFGSGICLRDRARLFRIIDFIGRWSMIDVFMVSILVAVVRFGFFANVEADNGIVAFAAVVVLTIMAVEAFDPRLMWDVLERPASRRQSEPERRGNKPDERGGPRPDEPQDIPGTSKA